ncbi:hypothetical protein PT974_06613 [Cladobotryum mycophilum]|uniref:Tyrosine specific protein phosphatases domain-containing protein n=1 Tax=Cladobotryum mycophilum TaxID=491253 RepID=A0ABR0SN50_9HYPO
MDQPSQLPSQIANFRDVGVTINQFLGERRIREGLFYRSARPDEATPKDKALIRDEMGIRTIIDLRTRTEHLKQAEKHNAPLQMALPLRQSLPVLMEWSIEPSAKLVFFYVFGYRMSAVKIISHKVMRPRGPVRLGLVILDHSGSEICQILSLYTSSQSLPSLLHCTHGKDRTGLICVLILTILGIPIPAIEHDYFLSDAGLISQREVMLKEISEVDLTEEWMQTAKDMITEGERHLTEHYGGIDNYLDRIGFDQVRRDKLREVLLY